MSSPSPQPRPTPPVPPPRPEPAQNQSQKKGPPLAPLGRFLWARLREFSSLGGGATYLWPRWIFLRAVGLVFVVVFTGIIGESDALIGPGGLAPLPGLIAQLRAAAPSAIDAFLKAPTLLWFQPGPGAVVTLAWTGLAGAFALVLNLWPRMALFTCWIALLSFANAWVVFSDPQVDWLLLEVALLSIPFAPAGYRPRLGAHAPPRVIALFMMRWLLFRVMFENGLSKLIHADPRWLNLTALDDLHQTTPCPTFLGYLDHQLPHAWHVAEIGLTYAAEVIAPLVAVLAGRPGRWWAFGCWTIFQVGIQATHNFGWLNTAALALGILLLDDRMLADAARRCRLVRLGPHLMAVGAGAVPPVVGPWRRYGLRVALGTHCYLSVVFFLVLSCKIPENALIAAINRPLRNLCQGFGSVNAYGLFAWLDQAHHIVEFSGSNDGGQTWRPFDYRYFPQRADRIPPFLAPRFPRFEAALQIEMSTRDKPTTLYALTAIRLLERSPAVMRLFDGDPFPDRPAQMIRLQVHRLTFTDWTTYQQTRCFWHRHYVGEYAPMKFLTPAGQVKAAATTFDQLYVQAAYQNPQAQNQLAFLYLSGEEDVVKNSVEAAKWYRRAAEQEIPGAQLNLALLYANGDGVTVNAAEAAHWCRRAAENGLADAQNQLGLMYLQGAGLPADEIEALAWFVVAALAGNREAATRQTAGEFRLSPAAILAAQQRSRVISEQITARKKTSGTSQTVSPR